MNKIKSILAFAALIMCGGAWADYTTMNYTWKYMYHGDGETVGTTSGDWVNIDSWGTTSDAGETWGSYATASGKTSAPAVFKGSGAAEGAYDPMLVSGKFIAMKGKLVKGDDGKYHVNVGNYGNRDTLEGWNTRIGAEEDVYLTLRFNKLQSTNVVKEFRIDASSKMVIAYNDADPQGNSNVHVWSSEGLTFGTAEANCNFRAGATWFVYPYENGSIKVFGDVVDASVLQFKDAVINPSTTGDYKKLSERVLLSYTGTSKGTFNAENSNASVPSESSVTLTKVYRKPIASIDAVGTYQIVNDTTSKVIKIVYVENSEEQSAEEEFVTFVGENGAWDTDSNWSNGVVPTADDNVLISSAKTITLTPTSVAKSVTIDADVTFTGSIDGTKIKGVTITDTSVLTINIESGESSLRDVSGGKIIKTGAGKLLLLGDLTQFPGTITIQEGEIVFSNTSDQTISTVISGTGAVVKEGSGTLTLSGANTFSGGLTINAGAVKAGVGGVSSTSSAVGTGTVIVGANGTFDVNGKTFDTDGNGYTIESAGTLKNGGNICYANTRVIKCLTLTGDTTIATGERFGMGIDDGGSSDDQKSYIVMNGHTLNIDTSAYFNLQNTEITGGGEIVVKRGAFLGYGKACSYDGTLKTTGTGKLELNNDCTLTFTVQNFELGSDKGVTYYGGGDLKVIGTLSTAANHNYSVPRLIMGDGATIKLANSQRVSATTKFEIGDHLNIDCSAVTDTAFDAIEVPAAFHNNENWPVNSAKIKSWIGPYYKVGTYAFENGNWLRILFGGEPQTKSTEVVTSDGEKTIENVVLPMAITETGKTNQPAANGEMKVWEAYVLGLKHTDATAKPIVLSTQTAEAGSIKLVDNLTPKKIKGVNVTRKLFVGAAPGSMSEVQDASYDNGFTVDVPTGVDKVKYLKIKYDFAAQ